MTTVMQRTIKKSFSLEGKGLHTGADVCITFKPAPENYGYKIRRTDVLGNPIIDALAENVVDTRRCTVLSDNRVTVSTVEHALAALYACEIDNCLIEINGPEFPILDGSAIQYLSKIKATGIQLQNEERRYITLKRKRIRVVDEKNASSMILLPDESLSIETAISFKSPLLRRQTAVMSNLSDFAGEFASARTFVFVKEVENLILHNLIKGGDLDNAIVIYDEPIPQDKFDKLADLMNIQRRNAKSIGYLTNRPLIYPNEPARHKVLDIMGDLALTGAFIKGKVIADRPGHTINNLFAKAIREYYLSRPATRKLEKAKNPEMQIPQAVPTSHFYWNRP